MQVFILSRVFLQFPSSTLHAHKIAAVPSAFFISKHLQIASENLFKTRMTLFRWTMLVLLLLAFLQYSGAVSASAAPYRHGYGAGARQNQDVSSYSDGPYVVKEPFEIARTDFGHIRCVRMRFPPIPQYSLVSANVHLFFITIDPRSLLLPMIFSRDFVFYVQTGRATLGVVRDYDLRERNVKAGDIYRIPAGTVFHVLNTDNSTRFRIIGILALHPKSVVHFMEEEQSLPQIFLFGGGLQAPGPVFAGFDAVLLEAAFKVPRETLTEFMRKLDVKGPIVQAPKNSTKRDILSSYVSFIRRPASFLEGVFADWNNRNLAKGFNVDSKGASFENNYGWSISANRDDYKELGYSDLSMFMVNLTRGSMMAPHMNPRATEIAVVTRGEGILQLVHPNGSYAGSFRLKEGDVFMVPRYYLMSQLAAGDGPDFVFVGFSSCSEDNEPQFFAGANSLFNILDSQTMASVFRVSRDYLSGILSAQTESVIFPCQGCVEELMSKVESEEEERRTREAEEEEEEDDEGGRRGGQQEKQKQSEEEEEALRKREEAQMKRWEEVEKERETEREREGERAPSEEESEDWRPHEEEEGEGGEEWKIIPRRLQSGSINIRF